MSIAIIVPTIRPEKFKKFEKAWSKLIKKHKAILVCVEDGVTPKIGDMYLSQQECRLLVYNLNDGIRNFGFWYAARELPNVEYIITLDDDVLPIGDPIQDHINALNTRVPISWMSTASKYMRGVPYEVRTEAEVVLSHGVWQGVKDWDAPTQLVRGNEDVSFFKGPVPKGIYYPMCGMNLAFKRKLLPYMYFAPMGHRIGMDRFTDIWCGIESKRVIDRKGWAVVTGYSKVYHERASNVWKNLQKEAKGMELNEGYWRGQEDDPYFKLYRRNRKLWKNLICQYA